MNYFISKCDCVIWGCEKFEIKANVRYQVDNMEKCLICGCPNFVPFLFVGKESENVSIFQYGGDKYFYFQPHKTAICEFRTIKIKNFEVCISVSNKLLVTLNGETLVEEQCVLTFSHHDSIGEFDLLYFYGERNYVVILRGKDVEFSGFYDECNFKDKHCYFMQRQNDVLNHGRVIKIMEHKCENYLVYLDDEELKLNEHFIGHVFLDCLMAGNLKYANNLLCDELKQNNANKIKEFFPEVDKHFPVGKNEFLLIRKNTLAGVCEFEIVNDKIVNINCQ